jgi:tetratricopeptide (TPR) repeat protein
VATTAVSFYDRCMKLAHGLTVLMFLALATGLSAQTLSDARARYDAGKYREALAATAEADQDASPRLRYLAGLSHERLGEPEAAEQSYRQLAGLSVPAWQAIGQSALDLLHKQSAEALAAATRAVASDASIAEAHYQLGLCFSMTQDFAKAASAFDKAAEIDPQWSYARYYAGLAYSKVRRMDLLAERFEAFLTLAPNAPERPEVESIMRTIRGR